MGTQDSLLALGGYRSPLSFNDVKKVRTMLFYGESVIFSQVSEKSPVLGVLGCDTTQFGTQCQHFEETYSNYLHVAWKQKFLPKLW